jgi:hypothetical protein
MSKRFLLERFLGLSEEEIRKNEEMWKEERDQPEMAAAQGSDLRSVGISPGGLDTDIETGQEISQMTPAAGGTPGVDAGVGASAAPGGVLPASGTAPGAAAG